MEKLTNVEELMMRCIWGYGDEMPFLQMGASCIIKMWMLKIENTSEYNKTTDWQVSKNLIIQRGIYNEV